LTSLFMAAERVFAREERGSSAATGRRTEERTIGVGGN